MNAERRVCILVPLLLGAIIFVCTTVVHALPLRATVNLIRREKSRGRAGASFWIDVGMVVRTIFYASLAHLVEVGLWAILFVLSGEFRDFGVAYYHSAVNYTTLGYGDIVMSPAWELLGPLEAANGMPCLALPRRWCLQLQSSIPTVEEARGRSLPESPGSLKVRNSTRKPAKPVLRA